MICSGELVRGGLLAGGFVTAKIAYASAESIWGIDWKYSFGWFSMQIRAESKFGISLKYRCTTDIGWNVLFRRYEKRVPKATKSADFAMCMSMLAIILFD